jgi:ABC-type phosphate/phosphonate transport system substrate-binding protein
MKSFSRWLLIATLVVVPLASAVGEAIKSQRPKPALRAGNSERKELVRYAAANSRTDPITLGIASINPQKKIAEYQDFVNYLTRKLTSRNSRRGTLHVVPTPFELAQLLIDDKIDFFMDSPYPTHIVNAHAGSRLLARRWKNGVSEYRSVIITRKDSGITRLEDLRGTIIAFEDPDSTSGYFLPRTMLARRGLELRQRSSFNEATAPKEIGYLFAGSSEITVIDWVLGKNVSAGAVSDNDLEQLDGKKRSELMVLSASDSLPRYLVSVRKELAPRFGIQLKNILLAMHRDPEGKNILRKMENTTKFDALPLDHEDLQRRLFDALPNDGLAK